jgi:hypothetical protein
MCININQSKDFAPPTMEYLNGGKFHHSFIPLIFIVQKNYHFQIIKILLIFSAVFFVYFSGCMFGGPEMMGRSSEARRNESFFPSKMEKIWNEKTISLKPVFGGGGSSLLGGSGQSQGRMGAAFPLFASATFIDSALMDMGIEEFSSLAKMNDSEKVSYKTKYMEINKPDQYMYVWLELRTSYSADLLKLDNWSIFLEDDKGNQFDPKNTIEYKGKEIQIPGNFNPDRSPGRNNYWQTTSKVLQLYFPKKRYDGSPLINKDVKSIKLVMFNWNNNARFEGIWITDPKDNYSLVSAKP